MKVVYNDCFGGFGLSHKAIMRYAEIKGIILYAFVSSPGNYSKTIPLTEEILATNPFIIHYSTTPEYSEAKHFSDHDIERDDPALVQVVEELGAEANGNCASLAITDVAAGSLWRIDEYDGNESVATQESYEWRVAR